MEGLIFGGKFAFQNRLGLYLEGNLRLKIDWAIASSWREIYASNRPIRLTQCCTQFKSPRVKILCLLYLHYNVTFSFKCMEIPETKIFIPKGFELGTTLS